MIKNDKQYQVTKRKLKEFSDALIEAQKQEGIDPLLLMLETNSLKGQIEDFKIEINEYELLKKGNVSFIPIHSFASFTEALIKGRITLGWTQGELASKLNLKEQQIQRYEACNYSTASLPKIQEVADVLGLSIYPTKARLSKPYCNISTESIERASTLKNKLHQRHNKSILVIG